MSMDIGAYDGGLGASVQASSSSRQPRESDEFDRVRGGPAQWALRDFDIGRPLGKGHFGRVYLARLKTNGFILALKCLDRSVANEDVQRQVRREIQIMQELRHPNIIRLYGYFTDPANIYLMLEYAGQGELFRQLAKAGRFSEKRSARYVRQVADGLAYLHSKNVIHRDIKPENLLIGLNGEIKIGDFGWSVYSPEESQRTLCGTLSYVSPEMVLGQPHGHAIDIWALGVLAYEMVIGAEPFGADTAGGPRQVHIRICRVDVRFPEHVSELAKGLILSLLRLDPADRLPLEAVRDYPWVKQYDN
ncbi:spindle assembly checkpoint kinase [Cryptotrichosporon argae]